MDVLEPATNASLITYQAGYPSVDSVIVAWLQAKWQRSKSDKTRRAYEDTLYSFRDFCLLHKFDLDDQDERRLVAALSKWVARPGVSRYGKEKAVTNATYNHRLAVVASFYDYVRKHRLLPLASNPANMVDRLPVQEYKYAVPLTPEEAADALARIDRSALHGLRDYAILALGFYTGRRLAELAALTVRDLVDTGAVLHVTFPHAKGGKVMLDTLTNNDVRPVLLEYIIAAYGDTWQADTAAPVWVSFAKTGKRLGPAAIVGVCRKYLHTSKSHTLRHTAAFVMEEAGLKLSEIQGRLGHQNAATTGRYLQSLNRGRHLKGEERARMLGIAARG